MYTNCIEWMWLMRYGVGGFLYWNEFRVIFLISFLHRKMYIAWLQKGNIAMCFGSKFLIGRAFFLVDYVMEMCYHANENCLLLAQLKEDFFRFCVWMDFV